MAHMEKPACLRLACLLFGAAIVALGVAARAQVVAAAKGGDQSFWVGAEYSNIRASFPYGSGQRLWGASIFADLNWNRNLGVEGDARFLRFSSYAGENESSYLAGPRYTFMRFGKFQPYAKGLVGLGRIRYPYHIGTGNYFAVAPGAGLRYHVNYRWSLRAEYEFQWWPGSPGFTNQPRHELMPNGFHLGIAYRPFR